MIYKATELIAETFKKEGLKFRVEDRGDSSTVDAGFGIKNGPDVVVHFISRDDGNTIAVRAFSIVNDIDEEDRVKVAYALNKINCKYRFVKFCVDKDGDVNAEYDVCAKMTDEGVGPVCVEIFSRMMAICDDAYRDIMRAIL